VRLHREGEGAPYTGLKPAGLDWGPVVPKAERASAKEDPKQVIQLLTHAIEEELQKRFKQVMVKKKYDVNDVDAARAHQKLYEPPVQTLFTSAQTSVRSFF